MSISKEDYALAINFDFSSGDIIGHQNNLMSIYDVHSNLGENVFGPSQADIDLSEFDWIIINKEDLRQKLKRSSEPSTEAIAEMEQLIKEGSPDRNKIYESNNLSVFRSRE